MRRDVFIQNDSGGFSVLAASAVDEIIEDGRDDDLRFVTDHKAMLLELYGDDSMPVRIVVDEPLLAEEEQQWLARASWRLDTPDGRFLVMGGFDPDVLSSWKDEHEAGEDGTGVAVAEAEPGSWRVDIYAHVGSMNGRQILSEAGEMPGAFFRRSHPDRAFPVWLAKMLEFSGEEDPGHEELWRNPAQSVKEGRLEIDTDAASAVGFLIHFTRFNGSGDDTGRDIPEGGWFDREAGKRVPAVFPLGLTAAVPDPDLEGFLDRLLSRPRPDVEIPVATQIVEIIEVWPGDPLKRLTAGGEGASPERALPITKAYYAYWTAALTSDSPPRFEYWVTTAGDWTPPDSCAEFAVVSKGQSKGESTWALGPPPNAGGWFMWRAARVAAESLADVPEGSTLDLAMAPQDPDDLEANPGVGLALYRGLIKSAQWHISEASPAVSLETLDAALTFVADLAEGRKITVRDEAEGKAFDATASIFSPEEGSLIREGDVVRLADDDERMLLLLAQPVFRTRFGSQWRTDPVNDEDEEDEDDD